MPSAATLAGAAFLSILAPVGLLVCTYVGFNQFEVEKRFEKMWIKNRAPLAEDMRYVDEYGPSDGKKTLLLTLMKSRNDADLSDDPKYLLALAKRLKETFSTRINIFGEDFSYDDVCVNLAGPYTQPCFRYTTLDCFTEGNFDYTETNAESWRAMVFDLAKSQMVPLIGSFKAQYFPEDTIAKMSIATQGCADKCDAAKLPVVPPFKWEDSSDCNTCVTAGYDAMMTEQRLMEYTHYVRVLWPKMPHNVTHGDTAATLKVKHGLAPDATDDDAYAAAINKIVMSGIAASQPNSFMDSSPYVWKHDAWKNPRETLVGMNKSTILKTVSKDCFMWDGGQAFPFVNKYLTLGGSEPGIDTVLPTQDTPTPRAFKSFLATMDIWPMIFPASIVKRLASPDRPGGPLIIDESQAVKILYEFKLQLEKVYSAGWDHDGKDGRPFDEIQFTARTDDQGADGSTHNAFGERTMKGLKHGIPMFIIVAFVSAIFFVDWRDPIVQSRCVIAFIGTCIVVLGMFASLAICVLGGMKLGVATTWTMPFILVGILCDDMYMLILAMDAAEDQPTPEGRWLKAMKSVGLPITVTTVVNFGIFATISVASDLPAIYEMGKAGMVATASLYVTLMTSFTMLLYFDLLRRHNGRFEICCCVRRPDRGSMQSTSYMNVVFQKAYKPALHSLPVRVVVLLVALLVVLFVGCMGLNDVEKGLELEDMYKKDSQNFAFIHYRGIYFPVLGAILNWGQLSYTEPRTQMKMIKQWEDVASTDHLVPGLDSRVVWVAAMARWGMLNSTKETYPACGATMVENVFALRNATNRGYCYQDANMVGVTEAERKACASKLGCCPVIKASGREKQLATCIEMWSKEEPTVLGRAKPGFRLVPGTQKPVVPIMISQAGGNDMYVIKLKTTQDFIRLIEQTRAFTDEDPDTRAWMSGIAFNYWEQYLDIVDFVVNAGAITCAGGFVLSWILLFFELTVNKFGTWKQRFLSVTVGATLVAMVQAASMASVMGFAAYVDTTLSAFSALSVLLSSGFAIEYSVHVIHHFLEGQDIKAVDRVAKTMSFLFAPTFMSVISSAISVLPLALSGLTFVTKYFFTPLMMVVIITYFYGIVALPTLLSFCQCLPVLVKDGGGIKEEKVEVMPPPTPPMQAVTPMPTPPIEAPPPARVPEPETDEV